MSGFFKTSNRCHSMAAGRVLSAATVAVTILPACAIAAIIAGYLRAAEAVVLVNCLAYAVGYAAAAGHCRTRCVAAVAEARRDPLTGLPNRAPADTMLTEATAQHTPVTVALIDVDGLHAVNANLGHAAGDAYLRIIAERLSTVVPDAGILVRQGGDEFTLLGPGLAADAVATAISVALSGPSIVAGHRMQPRASVGIADSRGGDANYARGCADAAMYSAKAAGGNHALVYDPRRDGVPEPDGTRPLRRRRDIDPLVADGVAWLPSPAAALIPLLLPVADLRTIHHVLTVAADRWAHAADQARAGACRPGPAPSTTPDAINVEPAPDGYRGLARIAAELRQIYTRIAQQLAPAIEATADLDDQPAGQRGMSAAVLVGVSAAFPPADIEDLVVAAARAVHERRAVLTNRQRRLAARAHALLGSTPR